MVKEKSMSDSINHPLHYNKGNIEVIEFIEDQDFGYHEKHEEDLKKAIWYIQREIETHKVSPRRPNEMNL